MSIVTVNEVKQWLPALELDDFVIQGLIFKAQTYMESTEGADRILELNDRVDELRVINSEVQVSHLPVNVVYGIRGIRNRFYDEWGRRYDGIYFNYGTSFPVYTSSNTEKQYEELPEDVYYIDPVNNKLFVKAMFSSVEVKYQTGWDFSETDPEKQSNDVKTLKFICLSLIEMFSRASQILGIKKDDLLGITYNEISVFNEIDRIIKPLNRFRPIVYYYV